MLLTVETEAAVTDKGQDRRTALQMGLAAITEIQYHFQ
jgi:hypothetical protein